MRELPSEEELKKLREVYSNEAPAYGTANHPITRLLNLIEDQKKELVQQDNLIRMVAVFPRDQMTTKPDRWLAMLNQVDAYLDSKNEEPGKDKEKAK